MRPTYEEARKLNDAYKKQHKGSADRKRTERRKALLDAGIHPATDQKLRGPYQGEDVTCGDCAHSLRVTHGARSYWKCELAGITRGPGTDIRKSWPACVWFEKEMT